MSVPRTDHPAFIFTAVLFSKGTDIRKVLDELGGELGEALVTSRDVDFVWSDYYEQEMGRDLKRVFVVYSAVVQRDELVAVKRLTDKMESRYSRDGKRSVNIDPGLVCLENIVLATNKPFFHRVYLSDGVYAEVTLFYKHGTYNPIEYWSYPEYRSTPVLEFFNNARDMLAKRLDK